MQHSTRYISAWKWYCWWEGFGRFPNLDRCCFLGLVLLPSFSCDQFAYLWDDNNVWMVVIYLVLLYTSRVPVLKPLSSCHYPSAGVVWFQGLFYNFVSLSGPERWLRKRFVKYGIPLLLWLLRRAVVVIFSRPGSRKSSWVNFRWLHSPSRFCFIVVVSWLMLWDPYSVQQTTAGKKYPIDMVRSNSRPASREMTNIESTLRMNKWMIT